MQVNRYGANKNKKQQQTSSGLFLFFHFFISFLIKTFITVIYILFVGLFVIFFISFSIKVFFKEKEMWKNGMWFIAHKNCPPTSFFCAISMILHIYRFKFGFRWFVSLYLICVSHGYSLLNHGSFWCCVSSPSLVFLLFWKFWKFW